MRLLPGALLGAVLACVPGAMPVGADEPADGAATLARYLARPDEPVTRYRVLRRMRVAALGREAWMDVRVELDPERGFRWSIESGGGSKKLREKCLVRMLETEAEAHATGAVARSSLTEDNYLIEAGELDADGLVRLRVRARRRDSTLFDGFFVVTPEDAELLRVEGRLARSPSFWIPRADVVRHFARVGGHRVVVRCESTAQLRLLGESRLVVSYDYEMIDGRLLPSETVASSPLPEPDVVGSSQTRP